MDQAHLDPIALAGGVIQTILFIFYAIRITLDARRRNAQVGTEVPEVANASPAECVEAA
jgi:hypothetical protein